MERRIKLTDIDRPDEPLEVEIERIAETTLRVLVPEYGDPFRIAAARTRARRSRARWAAAISLSNPSLRRSSPRPGESRLAPPLPRAPAASRRERRENELSSAGSGKFHRESARSPPDMAQRRRACRVVFWTETGHRLRAARDHGTRPARNSAAAELPLPIARARSRRRCGRRSWGRMARGRRGRATAARGYRRNEPDAGKNIRAPRYAEARDLSLSARASSRAN